MMLQTENIEITKILLSETHRKPIETDLPDRRPRHARLETHQRPTSETDMPVESNRNLNIYLNINIFTYFLLIYIHTCQSLLGHVGFRWVYD